MACDKLTDYELAAINLCAQFGTNPKKLEGYEKVSHLFTEQDGTKAHEDVKGALTQVVLKRLA